MKNIFSLWIIILGLSNNNYLSAQVKTNFNSQELITQKGKFEKSYTPVFDFEVPEKNINDLIENEKKEIKIANEIKPFKIAVPVNVDINLAKTIKWQLSKDFAYGKYAIHTKGALSASINFDKFFLPKGTEMYIYNVNGEMITGPITENENNRDSIWGSWVFRGPQLFVEIKCPANEIDNIQLHINNIAYGYKELYKSIKVGGFGQSGSCNINVVCPLGSGWEPERNSVATILSSNGSEFCSGALIMNTCNSKQPLFLTANHCFDNGVSSWRFNFQAWSPTCPNPGTNVSGVMYNGATLKARNAESDFCLLELNTIPPSNSGLHYAGWTRSNTPALNATAIHHPRGDVMKISRANNPVSIGSYAGTVNKHWRADWSPQNNGAGQIVTAVTEPASSGSPLFDQDHRIIGQLHGGPSVCGGSQLWDFYGRFDLSWTGGGTNSTRLSNWLDPSNSGAMTTNTTSISQLSNSNTASAVYINGDYGFCNTGIYSLANAPIGAVVAWNITPSGAATLTPNGNQVTVTPNYAAGNVTLSATLSGACYTNSVQVQKQIAIGVPDHLIDVLEYQGILPVNDFFSQTNYSFGLTSIAPYPYYPYFVAEPYQFASTASYTWRVIYKDGYGGSSQYYLGSFSYNDNPSFYFEQPGEYEIMVDIINNSCAYHSRYFTRTIIVQNMFGYYSVSPNPSSSNIKIQSTTPSTKSTVKLLDIREIEIIDKMGIVKQRQKFGTGLTTVNVSVSSLLNDIYMLRIFDGKKWHVHRLVVQH